MKKSELRQIIKEEIVKALGEEIKVGDKISDKYLDKNEYVVLKVNQNQIQLKDLRSNKNLNFPEDFEGNLEDISYFWKRFTKIK
jgi:hypothetical protein